MNIQLCICFAEARCKGPHKNITEIYEGVAAQCGDDVPVTEVWLAFVEAGGMVGGCNATITDVSFKT